MIKAKLGRRRIDTIGEAELLAMLERLLKTHGVISDPECRTVRCECHVCRDIYEMFDEANEL